MAFVLERPGLGQLVETLIEDGYAVYAPVVVDHAIRYRRIEHIDEVATGVRDVQGPGSYELTERSDDAMFGHTVPVNTLKDLFFPPKRPVWTATSKNGSIEFTNMASSGCQKVAVIGARACELAAMAIHDTVLTGGPYVDADYVARRDDTFIVTVDCTEPGEVCFCASMGTGPAATDHFDLALTEVLIDGTWEYVGRWGTERGESAVAGITHRVADHVEMAEADSSVSTAASSMGRDLDSSRVPEFLAAQSEHPAWADIAERCLACGNCTQACPTCFCVSTIDESSLDGITATHSTRWDSCFSLDFSYMGGRPHRSSIDARYRQWLTHKLSSWIDQFGTSGCVGCGRCITWCPVGIDFTVEIPKMMATADA